MTFACRILLGALGFTLLTHGSGLAYETIDINDGGTVSGIVRFKGAPPPIRRMLITKENAVCGDGYREVEEVSVSNGALRDVVVFVESIGRGKPWHVPEGGYVIDQKGCAFHPYVSVVPQGAELLILNSDPVLHNIHGHEVIGRASRTLFNIAQPKFRPRVTRTIRTTQGKVVRIECDAHNWMLGWLFVTDSPYAAVVGKDGHFTIDHIPPGKYTLKAWHPVLGVRETEITVSAKGRVDASLEFHRPE